MSRWCAISAIRHRNFSPCGTAAEFLHARSMGLASTSHMVLLCAAAGSGRHRWRCLGNNEPRWVCHHRPYPAKNLVQIIIDNGANGSTGFQPSFTAGKLKLDQIARAAGITRVTVVRAQKDIAPTVAAALAGDQGPSVIVIRTEVGMPDNIAVIPLGAIEIRDRFVRSLAGEAS